MTSKKATPRAASAAPSTTPKPKTDAKPAAAKAAEPKAADATGTTAKPKLKDRVKRVVLMKKAVKRHCHILDRKRYFAPATVMEVDPDVLANDEALQAATIPWDGPEKHGEPIQAD